jgi:hypothetical protein
MVESDDELLQDTLCKRDMFSITKSIEYSVLLQASH